MTLAWFIRGLIEWKAKKFSTGYFLHTYHEWKGVCS
jgi:hypothetical protein